MWLSVLLPLLVVGSKREELPPLPDHSSSKQLPVSILGTFGALLHYPEFSNSQSAYMFLLSKGLGVNNLTRIVIDQTIDRVSNAIESAEETSPREIVLPIKSSKGCLLLQYSQEDNPTQLTRNFLDENGFTQVDESAVEAIVNQLKLRSALRRHQEDSFQTVQGVEHANCRTRPTDEDDELPRLTRLLDADKVPAFVINLWNNHARRSYMKSQLSGVETFWMPGVDALSIPQFVLRQVMHEETKIMIQSHLAAAIAHIQTWNEIIINGLPFAMVFEDDMHIVDDDFRCKIEKAIKKLPANWGILYLDYSDEHYWDNKHLRTKQLCIESAKKDDIVQIDGVCSSGSTRAYVVSHFGARILAKTSLPIWRNADVYLRDMIYTEEIEAFALTKPIATAQLQLNRPSEMSERSIKLDMAKDEVVLTYAQDDIIDCGTEICPVYLE